MGVTLTAAALGALAGLGLLLAALGARGVAPRPPATRRASAAGRGGGWWRAAIPFAAAVAVLGLTGWVAGAALAAVAALALPSLLGGASGRRAAIDRTEAIARWTEMLRDTIAGAVGLEEAIAVTAAVAPPAIAAEVGRLALRLERHPLPDALRDLASDLADPAADLLVAALTTAATRETRELGRLLSALAASTRDVARMRERVETGRAGVRSAVRMITITVGVFVGGLVVFRRDFLAPYDSAEGQLWLLLVGATFAGGFALLRATAALRMPPRSFAFEGADDGADLSGVTA